jgi:hypothetical protein
MARTPLSGVRKLLGYASALLGSAVRGQLTQAWAWDTFKAAQQAAGETVTGVSASDMSRLIGWVNQSLTARDNLIAADTTAVIDSTMVAPYATYVLSPTVAASPKRAVSAQVVTTATGEQTIMYYWAEITAAEGLTKGALLDLVNAGVAARQAATPTTYGQSALPAMTVTVYRI